MEGIKCCNQCDACKTPKASMGYSPNKLRVASNASLDPSQPSMAILLKRAKKAKSLMAKKKGLGSQVAPLKKAAVQPVKRKAQKPSIRPSISRLLSRRRGKNILMTVKIPTRNPFPPPLAPSG